MHNYVDLVAQAEKAVAGVKDPELRKIAFQRILDDLLGASDSKGAHQAPSRTKESASAAPKKKGAKAGPNGRLVELCDDGFFAKPKTIAQVKAELENQGHHIPVTSLSGPLQRLCQRKVLRRQKVKASGKKETFTYSNW